MLPHWNVRTRWPERLKGYSKIPRELNTVPWCWVTAFLHNLTPPTMHSSLSLSSLGKREAKQPSSSSFKQISPSGLLFLRRRPLHLLRLPSKGWALPRASRSSYRTARAIRPNTSMSRQSCLWQRLANDLKSVLFFPSTGLMCPRKELVSTMTKRRSSILTYQKSTAPFPLTLEVIMSTTSTGLAGSTKYLSKPRPRTG